jgi:DNA-binding transcriptional MerR regulator
VNHLRALRALLERRLLGLSVDEIRYTFEDVRAELRATRAELKEELAALRRDLDRLGGGGGRGEEDEKDPIVQA